MHRSNGWFALWLYPSSMLPKQLCSPVSPFSDPFVWFAAPPVLAAVQLFKVIAWCEQNGFNESVRWLAPNSQERESVCGVCVCVVCVCGVFLPACLFPPSLCVSY